MNHMILKICILILIILVVVSCDIGTANQSPNENLINKTNIVEERWINYKGTSENNKAMMQSQFIPYNPEKDYEVSGDTYVSYFNGEDFMVKTSKKTYKS